MALAPEGQQSFGGGGNPGEHVNRAVGTDWDLTHRGEISTKLCAGRVVAPCLLVSGGLLCDAGNQNGVTLVCEDLALSRQQASPTKADVGGRGHNLGQADPPAWTLSTWECWPVLKEAGTRLRSGSWQWQVQKHIHSGAAVQ